VTLPSDMGAERRHDADQHDARVVFIVGVGRSGTSLLQSMLNAHPKVSFIAETQALRNYVLNKKTNAALSAAMADNTQSIPAQILSDNRLKEMFGSAEALQTFLEANQPATALEFYLALLNHNQGSEAIWSGDKDPRLLESTQSLLALFPASLVLHIVRDPRDVVLSKLKASWSSKRPWWLHAFTARAQLDAAGPNHSRCHVLYYEDLLEAPHDTLSSVTKFLDIPFSEQMIEFQTSAKELLRESERAWKENTLKELMPDNKELWRSELTPFQIAFTEAVVFPAKHVGDKYSQADGSKNLPFWQQSLCHIGAMVAPLFSILYRRLTS